MRTIVLMVFAFIAGAGFHAFGGDMTEAKHYFYQSRFCSGLIDGQRKYATKAILQLDPASICRP